MATENLKIIVEELHFVEQMSGNFIRDPAYYVKINMGYDDEWKTKTVFGQEQSAKFIEEFDLGEARKDKIIVKVFDEGLMSDDFIGEATIFMDQLKMGTGTRNGYSILKDTITIGNLFIESIYTGGEAEEAPVEEKKEEEAPAEETPPVQNTAQPAIPQYPNP